MSLTAEFKAGLKEAFLEAGDVKETIQITHVDRAASQDLQLEAPTEVSNTYSLQCVYANYKEMELSEAIERGDVRLYVDHDDIQGLSINDYVTFKGGEWRVIDYINHYEILVEVQIRS